MDIFATICTYVCLRKNEKAATKKASGYWYNNLAHPTSFLSHPQTHANLYILMYGFQTIHFDWFWWPCILVRFILYEKTLRMSSDFSNIRKRCNLIWTFHFFPKNWQLLMSSQHSFSVVQYRRGERNGFVAYPYPPTARRHVVDVSKIEIIIHTRRAHL